MFDRSMDGWLDLKPISNIGYAFAKKMIDTPKVVFTKTLNKSQWVNTDIATGNLTDEITKSKSQDSKDIIVHGGASFLSLSLP